MKTRRIDFKASGKSHISAIITPEMLGFVPKRAWCPVPTETHRTESYRLPKTIRTGTYDTPEACAKLTPNPVAIVAEGDCNKTLVCVKADCGWHLWNLAEFVASKSGVEVRIDLEGHSTPSRVAKHVSVLLVDIRDGETPMELLTRGLTKAYPAAYRKSADAPDWWCRPNYCGWGDQVAMSLALEGPGDEQRANNYCTQGLYERWLARLEQAEVPIGTVTIDAGWSLGGVWDPLYTRWPDLRGFIDRQHDKGRRVLLWIPTWFCEGLPDEWCVHSGKTKLVADPSNPAYRCFVKAQVHKLISPDKGCYNADGFKIDQLQYVPCEHRVRGCSVLGSPFFVKPPRKSAKNPAPKLPKMKVAADRWGMELLYLHQKDIYAAAKCAKADALVTSSTVHPYFYDTLDMVRLHDTIFTGCDVFDGMKLRAELSRATLPAALIDTDDWISDEYDKWLDYTLRSSELGVPCLFYAEHFVHYGKKADKLPMKDLKKLARAWRKL